METWAALDEVFSVWLPHVTLDQHQMDQHGPGFVLPPYAAPWEPHVPADIIAASNALGQAVAAALTLAGLSGVVTGCHFDAWEPSRALQHYRGGIRILAEAASADIAHPVTVSTERLAAAPMPQPATPSAHCPKPWKGGSWHLQGIIRYYLAAAKSILTRVATEPARWLSVQRAALASYPTPPTTYAIPLASGSIDRSANRQLAEMLTSIGANVQAGNMAQITTDQPVGSSIEAVLRPKPYPAEFGPTAYDVTTHYLPLLMGATVHDRDETAFQVPASPLAIHDCRDLLIDARNHAAPIAIEPALQ